MATVFEELQVLRLAEAICDEIWRQVTTWKEFQRQVVGGQLARAADSIGANIAESYGRFHYGEKINFLYFARGSLFETKYWLNRCAARNLMPSNQVQDYIIKLTDLARQLNAFAGNLKAQRHDSTKPDRGLRESTVDYAINTYDDHIIFTTLELEWLESPISNL